MFESPKKEGGRHQESLYKNKKTGKLETKEELQNPSRRTFLKRGVALTGEALTGLASAPFVYALWKSLSEREGEPIESTETGEGQEKAPSFQSAEEQLRLCGEIIDSERAVVGIFEEHYQELKDSNRLEAATRLRRELSLDHDEFVAPFVRRGLKADLAYLISYQESDFDKNKVSSSGAKGLFQIRDIAAEDVGMAEKDPHEPMEGSEIAAAYLSKNRDDYGVGDDTCLLLHSYNSGWRLQGFTETALSGEKTPSNFYHFLCDEISRKYKEGKEKGLSHDEIRGTVISKELEVLRYVPEMEAKGLVLQEKELLTDIADKLKSSDTYLAYRASARRVASTE